MHPASPAKFPPGYKPTELSNSVQETVRPEFLDIILLGIPSLLSLLLTFMAYLNDSGSTPAFSKASLAAVVFGGFLTTFGLVGFRSADLKRKTNPYYTTPRWHPAAIASILVLLGWISSFISSFWIGLSWSRR